MEQTDLNLNKERERLLTFLFRKRKIILSFSFVASALAFGLSYLITPLYLSTAIIFPAASSSVSFSEQRNTKASSMDFGEEEQAEQLVQILQSAQIKDLIVEKFDLMKHYNISESDGYKYDKLNKAYEDISPLRELGLDQLKSMFWIVTQNWLQEWLMRL